MKLDLSDPGRRFSLKQLAAALDMTTRTILRWRLRGLKSRREGHQLVFTAADVAEFIRKLAG